MLIPSSSELNKIQFCHHGPFIKCVEIMEHGNRKWAFNGTVYCTRMTGRQRPVRFCTQGWPGETFCPPRKKAAHHVVGCTAARSEAAAHLHKDSAAKMECFLSLQSCALQLGSLCLMHSYRAGEAVISEGRLGHKARSTETLRGRQLLRTSFRCKLITLLLM